MTKALADKINKWREADEAAKAWAEIALQLRCEIFGDVFPSPVVGSNKARIGYDIDGVEHALVGTYKLNYTIDKPALEASKSLIEPALLDTIISYTPKVNDGPYRKLDAVQTRLFGGFITEKPGTPAIELKPAKGMRW